MGIGFKYFTLLSFPNTVPVEVLNWFLLLRGNIFNSRGGNSEGVPNPVYEKG